VAAKLVVGALAALLLLPVGSAAAASPSPTRIQVGAKEFYFVVSRHKVVAGPAIIELVNYGEDPHDLRVERVGGTHVYRSPIVQPGPASYYDLQLTLLPGKYMLWCGVANHRQLGMQAVLTVVAKPKPKS
jgi:plastocyanin